MSKNKALLVLFLLFLIVSAIIVVNLTKNYDNISSSDRLSNDEPIQNSKIDDASTNTVKDVSACYSGNMCAGYGYIYIIKSDKLICLEVQTGVLKWSFKTNGFIHNEPMLFKNNIYLGPDESTYYCLNAIYGEVLWQFNVGDDDARFVPIITDSKTYCKAHIEVSYCPTKNHIYCFDSVSGAIIWDYMTKGDISQSDAIVIGNANCYIYTSSSLDCIEMKKGINLWCIPMEGQLRSPHYYKGKVYLISYRSDPYILYCFDANTGGLVWERKGIYDIFSEILISDDRIYLGGSSILCLDAITGKYICEYKEDNSSHLYVYGISNSKLWQTNISGPKVFYKSNIYFGSNGSKFICIDAETCSKLWQTDIVGPKVFYKRNIYVGLCGSLLCIDGEKGSEKWSQPGCSYYSKPLLYNDNVYIECKDGGIYCFNANTGDQIWVRNSEK